MEPELIKFVLTIAYDGTPYAGWQIQKVGLGVQQLVEEALAKLFPSAPRVHSSSRTDTGVHAIGMVVHVEIPKAELRLPDPRLMLAINAFLPLTIRVMSAKRCSASFHARFNATGKQYRYYIWNAPAMNPLLVQRAWHIPKALDIDSMRRAAQKVIGKHDFKSFAGTRSYEMDSTVRTVQKLAIKKEDRLITVIIEGDGFLYKMCRGLVGTLVQVGSGKRDQDSLSTILEARDRTAAGMTAPAHGLVLWKVFYRKGKS
ncbi:MAG: tRNA pseudouridine synthase [Verrucomicrobiales bacterium]|nr:tRNA pseudouridine synthase [Verrucomicrobiales bacterium]